MSPRASPFDATECFVIMPISDPEGTEEGHFRLVYELIFRPACARAGFLARRADDVAETDLIHADVLRRTVHAPMALCDLSSRNPNVLFELGVRQALGGPVTLVQEEGTPRIFDLSPLRCVEYRPDLRADHVVEDVARLTRALRATWEASLDGRGVNSLLRLLAL